MGKKILAIFGRGLIFALPFGICIYIIYFLFNVLDNAWMWLFKMIFHQEYRGLGFVLSMGLIFLIGLLLKSGIATKFIEKERILSYLFSLAKRIPVVGTVLRGMESAQVSLEDLKGTIPAKVEFLPGFSAYGFILGIQLTSRKGERLLRVFFPSSPFPGTGFHGLPDVRLIPEKKVFPLDNPNEEILIAIASGGFLSPRELKYTSVDKALERLGLKELSEDVGR